MCYFELMFTLLPILLLKVENGQSDPVLALVQRNLHRQAFKEFDTYMYMCFCRYSSLQNEVVGALCSFIGWRSGFLVCAFKRLCVYCQHRKQLSYTNKIVFTSSSAYEKESKKLLFSSHLATTTPLLV